MFLNIQQLSMSRRATWLKPVYSNSLYIERKDNYGEKLSVVNLTQWSLPLSILGMNTNYYLLLGAPFYRLSFRIARGYLGGVYTAVPRNPIVVWIAFICIENSYSFLFQINAMIERQMTLYYSWQIFYSAIFVWCYTLLQKKSLKQIHIKMLFIYFGIDNLINVHPSRWMAT